MLEHLIPRYFNAYSDSGIFGYFSYKKDKIEAFKPENIIIFICN